MASIASEPWHRPRLAGKTVKQNGGSSRGSRGAEGAGAAGAAAGGGGWQQHLQQRWLGSRSRVHMSAYARKFLSPKGRKYKVKMFFFMVYKHQLFSSGVNKEVKIKKKIKNRIGIKPNGRLLA